MPDDADHIVLADPSGKQHKLPIDLQRLQRTPLSQQMGSEGLVVMVARMRGLVASAPEAFAVWVCQLYAWQRGLQQPPTRADGSWIDEKFEEWFESVVSHAEQAPIGDPWADFVAEVINTSPDTPEAA